MSKQTKKQSLKESLLNTAVGFTISYLSTFFIFPVLGMKSDAGINMVITIYFTFISIARSYFIRRFFNNK